MSLKRQSEEVDKCKEQPKRAKKEYICEVCNKVFKQKNHMKRHSWSLHSIGNGKWFQCQEPNCDYQSKTKESLTQHTRAKHDTNVQWNHCREPNCNYKSKTIQGLKNHFKFSHETNLTWFKCEEITCEFKAKSIANLKQHLFRVHNIGTGTIFHCEVTSCTFTTKSSNTLKNHLIYIHNIGTYEWFKCSEPNCEYKSKTKNGVTQHLIQSHNINVKKIFVCDQPSCEYKTKKNDHLKMHQMRVHKIGLITSVKCPELNCSFCGKTNGELKIHLWCVHGKNGKWFVCEAPLCGFKSKLNGNLKQHHNSFHTERGQQRRKKKEEKTAKFLQEQNISFDREVHVDFKCALSNDRGQAFARIDFVVQRPEENTVFLIEVDEFAHSAEAYQLSCECRRMTDATTSLMMTQPLVEHWVWIRFNPDPFTIDNVKQKVKLQTRLQALSNFIHSYKPKLQMEIKYMYYSSVQGVPIVLTMPEFPPTLLQFCKTV